MTTSLTEDITTTIANNNLNNDNSNNTTTGKEEMLSMTTTMITEDMNQQQQQENKQLTRIHFKNVNSIDSTSSEQSIIDNLSLDNLSSQISPKSSSLSSICSNISSLTIQDNEQVNINNTNNNEENNNNTDINNYNEKKEISLSSSEINNNNANNTNEEQQQVNTSSNDSEHSIVPTISIPPKKPSRLMSLLFSSLLSLQDLKPSENQVAGHGQKAGEEHLVVRYRNNLIYKPINPNSKRAFDEVKFYENQLLKLPNLTKYVPKYHGLQRVQENDQQFIILEDLTYNFSFPSVLDIRMGRRCYGDDASPEKIKMYDGKYIYQYELGFSFSGMKVYNTQQNHLIDFISSPVNEVSPTFITTHNVLGTSTSVSTACTPTASTPSSGGGSGLNHLFPNIYQQHQHNNNNNNITFKKNYKIYDRYWGRYCKPGEETIEALEAYFFDTSWENPKQVGLKRVKEMYKQLKEIEESLLNNYLYRFYSSSLLFIYDKDKAIVRMIDFAHVHENKEPVLDENYIYGLKNLITYFEQVIKRNDDVEQGE
ncbi:hypothetical protein ABK040_016426 [Willaertia magna]